MSTHALHHVAIATFESGAGAVEGVRALLRAGFDVNRLSVAGKDIVVAESALGFYTSGRHAKYCAQQSESWNALANELCEAGLFLLRSIGPIVVLGPLVGCCVATLESIQGPAPVGLMEAALTRIGVPATAAARHEASLNAGRILVVVLCAASAVEHARSILAPTRPVEFDSHST